MVGARDRPKFPADVRGVKYGDDKAGAARRLVESITSAMSTSHFRPGARLDLRERDDSPLIRIVVGNAFANMT
jgi:hypothetical protein